MIVLIPCSYLPYRFSLAIGHYSSMLWSNTNKVGCGLTEYKDGKWFAKLYTCDYGPAGNYINGQIYKVGKACASCPRNMTCSKEYPGLCGMYRNPDFILFFWF